MERPVVDIVVPVYNGRDSVRECLAGVFAQDWAGFSLGRVVVVDDGSTDGTAEAVRDGFGDRVTLVRLGENQGRAAARNAGAAEGDGEVVVFIDCDCRFAGPGCLKVMVERISSGADACFGRVEVRGQGFWDQYMRRVNRERELRIAKGDFMVAVSAVLAVRRGIFLGQGGFDADFCGYGFEDRDLAARLIAAGAVFAYAPESVVVHGAKLSLESIARKVRESGALTSGVFAARHPDAYARMAYSRIDTRLHPWLRPFALAAGPFFPLFLRLSCRLVESGWASCGVKAFAVRSVSALAFMLGTADRGRGSA